MPVRCSETSCIRVATCAFPNSKRSRFCNLHKKAGMVIVLSGCCNADGCDKQPSFGFIGGKPRFCATHKLDGMTDVKNKRCEAKGCIKTPNFAEEGQKPRFCSAHKSPGHINVKGPFCYVDGCRRRRALSRFCIDHLDVSSGRGEDCTQIQELVAEVERLRAKLKNSESRVKQLKEELKKAKELQPFSSENAVQQGVVSASVNQESFSDPGFSYMKPKTSSCQDGKHLSECCFVSDTGTTHLHCQSSQWVDAAHNSSLKAMSVHNASERSYFQDPTAYAEPMGLFTKVNNHFPPHGHIQNTSVNYLNFSPRAHESIGSGAFSASGRNHLGTGVYSSQPSLLSTTADTSQIFPGAVQYDYQMVPRSSFPEERLVRIFPHPLLRANQQNNHLSMVNGLSQRESIQAQAPLERNGSMSRLSPPQLASYIGANNYAKP